jgi:hypothetical protein
VRTRHNWIQVSKASPCPVCKEPDWCSVSLNGTVAKCMRRAEGAFRIKTDKNGAEYYLHRLEGEAVKPPPPPGSTAHDRADADTLYRVYSALLAGLPLSEAHRDNLRRRGLSDAEIDRRGYGTLPGQGRAPLARELRERFGDAVLRVPGFVTRERDGRRYLTLAGSAGLLVPVRDMAERVVALLVRREGDGAAKYVWVSSAKDGGPGPGAPVHVPLDVVGPAEVVRVTEGAIKADVAHALSGLPTIGLPGVSSWRPALPILRELGAKTVRLALDGDARDKPAVARALAVLADGLGAEGLAVELERWPAEHKGIDDALAAGSAIEVLAGEAARQAIAEIVAEGTAGEPLPEPGPLDRLAEALAEGVEALFRDRDLLRELARLAEADPAEYACRRAQVHGAGVRLRDLDRALAPLRQEARTSQPPPDAAGPYRVSAGRIVRTHRTPDGAEVEVQLCNFSARIVEVITRDDGAEKSTAFSVEGALVDGRPLPRATVRAADFPRLDWVTDVWQGRAVVFAGLGTRDHLRCALELLSPDRDQRVEYLHTGWREVDGHWYYLHATGAIGQDGPATGIAVALPGALTRFELPAPPEGAALATGVRASLRLLDLAPARLTFPLLAAVYRAVLGPCDFSLHAAGATGVFKTETTALCQQHFGPGLDARHLPGSWSSTGNALEVLGFSAKDALFLVDDFAPSGSTADVQRFHREADRLLRAQGNHAGRQRLRSDATLRPDKPPRGLIVSTGEDVPRGQSLRARLLVLEFTAGDVDVGRLTACQGDAAAGRYAEALAGFLRWLAPRYPVIRDGLSIETAALRERVNTEGLHARTPGALADLALGLKYFFDFAVEAGAIDAGEREALVRQAWKALLDAGAAQAEHIAAADPVGHFRRLLAGALASGRAHVAGPDGDAPAEAAAWGWREEQYLTRDGPDRRWVAQGRRIGWLDELDLYLEPEAAYAEAQELARHQGEALPVSSRTLWRRLRERGLLASWDIRRHRNTVRRTLEGVRERDVLHLRAGALSPCTEPSEPSAKNGNPQELAEKRTVSVDGPSDGNGVCGGNRPQEPSAKPEESPICGRFGRSDTGEAEQSAPEIATPVEGPDWGEV